MPARAEPHRVPQDGQQARGGARAHLVRRDAAGHAGACQHRRAHKDHGGRSGHGRQRHCTQRTSPRSVRPARAHGRAGQLPPARHTTEAQHCAGGLALDSRASLRARGTHAGAEAPPNPARHALPAASPAAPCASPARRAPSTSTIFRSTSRTDVPRTKFIPFPGTCHFLKFIKFTVHEY